MVCGLKDLKYDSIQDINFCRILVTLEGLRPLQFVESSKKTLDQ